ncbi:MAG: hypothetical protein RMJ56_17155 [Gemmataceae bacterium]|nr:hypothetical protein [Gemmata sp.]MDW8199325.1 hypothetical protein [Gemmataceae bacterium]
MRSTHLPKLLSFLLTSWAVVLLAAENPAPVVVTELKGHTDTVEAVAVSPDGRFIATASFDQTVKLWETATGRLIRTYAGEQGHKGQVLGVAFSAAGDRLASSGADNRAFIWEVPVPTAAKSFPLNNPGTAVAIGADGKTLAIGDDQGQMRLFPLGEEKGVITLSGPKTAIVGLGQLGGSTTWVAAYADNSLGFFAANDTKRLAQYHQDTKITGFAIRPDGQAVFTTDPDGVIRFWQAPPPLSREFPELNEDLTALTLTPDGTAVLYASSDGAVTWGNTNNNQVVATFRGAKEPVTCLALAPDGQQIVAGCANGRLLVWNRDGKLVTNIAAHEKPISAVLYHPTQPLLITAAADGKIKVWKRPLASEKPTEKAGAATGDGNSVMAEFSAHTGAVVDVQISATTGELLTAGDDRHIRLWDLKKTDQPRRDWGPLDAAPRAVALAHDSKQFAVGVGKNVLIWKLGEKQPVGTLPQTAEVTTLSFNGDGSRLLVGRANSSALLVDVASGQALQAFPHVGGIRAAALHPTAPLAITAMTNRRVALSPITCTRVLVTTPKKARLVVSPGGERLITIGDSRTATSWSSNTGQKERSFEITATTTAVAVSKDGQRLAVGDAEGFVHLFTMADGGFIGRIAAGSPVVELAFHPTNPVLVGLLKDPTHSAVAWNVAGPANQPLPPEFGQVLQSFGHPVAVRGLVFNASGQFCTVAADKLARLFRIASTNPIKRYDHPNLVACVAFDDTGHRLATGCHDGRVRIYDVTKDNILKQIDAHIVTMPQTIAHPIYAVCWSRDAKQLFSASYDKSIKLWDVASGNLVREFPPATAKKVEPRKNEKTNEPSTPKGLGPQGHRDQVFSIALSKDGQFLASASSDGTVKLWNVAAGQVVREFPSPELKPVFPEEPAPSHPGWVHAVRFDAQGRLLSAGAAPKGRGSIAVWDSVQGKRLYGVEHPFGPVHALEILDNNRVVIGTASVPRNKTPALAAILQLPLP